MDSHLLFELGHVLYRIRATVIHGECWLMKTPRKLCLLYSSGKRWFRNLAQSFLHNISSYSPPGWTPAPSFMKMLLLTRKRLIRWSSWSLSVACIFFVIRRNIRTRKGLFPLCSTKLLLQIINFSLHSFFITLLMHCMTFSLITTSTCAKRLQTAFLMVVQILFTLKTVDLILLMNISWFCMVRTSFAWSWSRHDSTKALILPTDGANRRVIICRPNPKVLGHKPNKPNTINL